VDFLDAQPGGSGVDWSEVERYAGAGDPVQAYLFRGVRVCGGFGDWCCVCTAAKAGLDAESDPAVASKAATIRSMRCCDNTDPRNIVNPIPAPGAPIWTPVGWLAETKSDGSPRSDSLPWTTERDNSSLQYACRYSQPLAVWAGAADVEVASLSEMDCALAALGVMAVASLAASAVTLVYHRYVEGRHRTDDSYVLV